MKADLMTMRIKHTNHFFCFFVEWRKRRLRSRLCAKKIDKCGITGCLACASNKGHLILDGESSFGDLLHFLCPARHSHRYHRSFRHPRKRPYAVNGDEFSTFSAFFTRSCFTLSVCAIIVWLLLMNSNDIYSFLMHSHIQCMTAL